MKNVYLIDYRQLTRLNLVSNLLEPNLTLPKIRNIIHQQGGAFLEMQDSKTLERIATNNPNGIIYQYATNKISKEQFINSLNILFNLDNEKFTTYWENILNIGNLQLMALEELVKLQQSSDCLIHISGNITELNAERLNVTITNTGLKELQFTCSYIEGNLINTEYVSRKIALNYPNSSYNIVDLRSNRILTPDLFRENPSHTIAPRSAMKLTP